jgi:hypothetical protein
VALAAITSSVEGKIPKPLKKILKKITEDAEEELLVADAKLGSSIKVIDLILKFQIFFLCIEFRIQLQNRKNLISIVQVIQMFKI